jgi:hypothetical protein
MKNAFSLPTVFCVAVGNKEVYKEETITAGA